MFDPQYDTEKPIAVPSWSGRNMQILRGYDRKYRSRRPLMVGSEPVARGQHLQLGMVVAVPSWSGRNTTGGTITLVVGWSPSPHGRVGTELWVEGAGVHACGHFTHQQFNPDHFNS